MTLTDAWLAFMEVLRDRAPVTAVRKSVLDTAQSLHPGSHVQGGEAIFPQVPRQRGVTVNSYVQIDGVPRFYLTIVTGVENNVIVYEMPPGGFEFIVDD